MQSPLIRPGRTSSEQQQVLASTLVVYFRNSAQANAVIQLVGTIGVPADRLGVTPPDQLPDGQGMVLSIPCPDERTAAHVELICKQQGAAIVR